MSDQNLSAPASPEQALELVKRYVELAGTPMTTPLPPFSDPPTVWLPPIQELLGNYPDLFQIIKAAPIPNWATLASNWYDEQK
jgi:hypothetical protein